MTFGTKKGHFNAHKIAPVSNLGPFFITHDYTFTRHGAINSAPNILRMAVTQFAHGSAQGERPQLRVLLKMDLIHLPPAVVYQTRLNSWVSENNGHNPHRSKVANVFLPFPHYDLA